MISKIVNGNIVPLTESDKKAFCLRCGAEEGFGDEDYIARKDVLDLVDSGKIVGNEKYDEVRRMIEDIPSADVKKER